MDNKAGNAQINDSEQQSPVSLPLGIGKPLIGSWTIEENFPYGFVIRNVDPASTGTEYHFSYDSNGWVTCAANGKASMVMGPHGQTGSHPVLCDRASTKKKERIQELREKGQELNEAECRELLALTGLVKGKE